MNPFLIILIIFAVLLIGGIVATLAVTIPISKKVYFSRLVRTDKDKWGHVCSAPENEEQVEMWNEGINWAEENNVYMVPVKTENEGFNLYGELYRFDDKKCVIILPGRCECLKYSYYFAKPYEESGVSVLVIDSRSHGQSDGKYTSAGVAESRDVIKWANFLIEKGFEEIYIHGICVGAAAGILALSNKNCPKEIKGMVSEGCFVSFRETFKLHTKFDGHPSFPVTDLVMLQILKHTKENVYKDKPINHIHKVKQKMLFICGEMDLFSKPEKSQLLFDKCGSDDKELIWLEDGAHSHLRINNKEKYDNSVKDFLKG
jgi:esterase/lipase